MAALVDRPQLYVMSGRPRDPWHSWVVSKETGQPSKYEAHQVHPELNTRERVLSSSAQLEDWLRDPS